MNTEYLILVECTTPDLLVPYLRDALQEGYDNGGADGNFEIMPTAAGTHIVCFQRTTAEDDLSYLESRVADGCPDMKTAAMQQLASELDCVGTAALDVVAALRANEAKVIDFFDVLVYRDVSKVVEAVRTRAKKFHSTLDRNNIREAVDEAARLLSITLSDEQVSDACHMVLP